MFVALLLLAAYLIGAIPFGYLTAKWLRGVDIRTVGSGNIGATNVGRVLGLRFFFLVFAFDFAKGLLPTWGFPILFSRLTGQPAPPELRVLVALATILGHTFPVYLRFKGGKGVAASLGAALAFNWVLVIPAFLLFLCAVVITRFVSLASILAALTLPILIWNHAWRGRNAIFYDTTTFAIWVAISLLVIVKHHENIRRLLNGTESRLWTSKPKEGFND